MENTERIKIKENGKRELPAWEFNSVSDTDQISYNFINLPLTRLHYFKCGDGPPLIMMPATISEIRHWKDLARFMGQRFTTYFFELPGHGQSTKFEETFSSDLVAQTMEDLIDALGFDKVSILGFSFGGILTMKTLKKLGDRVEKVILISPAVTHKALFFSPLKKLICRITMNTLSISAIGNFFAKIIQNDFWNAKILKIVRKFVNVEDSVPLERRLKEVAPSTIEVIANQMREVLYLDIPIPEKKYQQKCIFGMSVLDPLLSFEISLATLHNHFENIVPEIFYFPYHQPKVQPNLETLNRDLKNFLLLLD